MNNYYFTDYYILRRLLFMCKMLNLPSIEHKFGDIQKYIEKHGGIDGK